MKTVLFINALADKNIGGGIEHTLWNLMFGLTHRNYRCVLLATDKQPGLHRSEEKGITVWRAGVTVGYFAWDSRWTNRRPHLLLRQAAHALTTYNPFMQHAIQRVIEHEAPDIVSTHNLSGISVAAWKSAHEAGKPCVHVLHDHFAICFNSSMWSSKSGNCQTPCFHCKIRRITTKPMSKYLTAVVGVSRYMLQRHQELGYFNQVPICDVIHDGRDTHKLGVPDQPDITYRQALHFGYLGRLDPIKGVDRLISAFKEAQIPNAILWIGGVGTESYVADLRHLIGNVSNIHMLGHTSPRVFFPQIDIAVVPSVCNEALGNVVFEAQAFGKVVLGARRGGILEMIDDGVNGLLFDPDNNAEFVTILQRVAADEVLRSRLATAAPSKAAYFMDMTRWLDQYENLYDKMISHHQAQL